MLRKFRFSLLSLMLFTTFVAIVIYWFLPYTVEVEVSDAANYGLVLPNQVLFVAAKDEKLRFKTQRRMGGGYRASGTLIFSVEPRLFCYSKQSHFKSLMIARRAESPIMGEKAGNIEKIIVDLDHDGHPRGPYYLLTDTQTVYVVDDVTMIGSKNGTYLYELAENQFENDKRIPPYMKTHIKKAFDHLHSDTTM